MGFEIADEGSHIEVRLDGFVSIDEVRAHFSHLTALLEEQRRCLGRARVIMDTSSAQTQSAEVAQLMRSGTGRIYADDDRVAVIATSSLLKVQIKRVLPIECSQRLPRMRRRASPQDHVIKESSAKMSVLKLRLHTVWKLIRTAALVLRI